ncbi:DUF1080 domain-containing protein [Flavobacterium frigoris]|nr:DUF1080 domain-containing protein [Flavobacterium frigoris]
MLKKITFAFTLLLLCNSCAVKQSLQMDDWYAITKDSEQRIAPAQVYDFSEGMIRMYGDNIGYLMTKKSYENFELSFDFRWNMAENVYRGSNRKNSGVMYNIPSNAPDHIWPKGIQFQIKEKSTGDFVFLDNVTATVNGAFIVVGASVTSPKFDDNEMSNGEWNAVLIQSYNGKCTQYLNGKLVNECVEASSKEGKISLNYEGSPIDFKNIRLKNINKL